ncbi:MAG: tRNA lysidine(34) synthetase TilS [Candidatus Omnitrophota bacterium]
MTLESKVLNYIREHQLIKPGDRVLLALSGGPDSVCLFHILRNLRSRLKFTLFSAHLDHGLRPGSEKDRKFCVELCDKYRIPIQTKKVSLKPTASEETSRKVRYNFLASAAEHFSCHSIATGHNQDDQSETVLLRLIRGTGLQGLAGIKPRRPLSTAYRGRPLSPQSKIYIMRPFLPVSREEITGFLKTKKSRFMTDSTNREDKYLRNKIRHKLLPLLTSYNPKFKETLSRLTEILSADYQYISNQASSFVEKTQGSGAIPALSMLGQVYGTSIKFPLKEFSTLPLALQREVIRQAVSTLSGTSYRTTYEEVETLRHFLLSGPKKHCQLLENLLISTEKNVISLSLLNGETK